MNNERVNKTMNKILNSNNNSVLTAKEFKKLPYNTQVKRKYNTSKIKSDLNAIERKLTHNELIAFNLHKFINKYSNHKRENRKRAIRVLKRIECVEHAFIKRNTIYVRMKHIH